MTTVPPQAEPLDIPNLDAIRAAIDAADERARLLRRLLRVALQLRVTDSAYTAARQREVANAAR